MEHTRMHFNATKYSLAKALKPAMDDLFVLAIDAYQKHRIDYLQGWQICFTISDKNRFEIALQSKNESGVVFTRQYDWTHLNTQKLTQDQVYLVKGIRTIINAINRNFKKKTDQHVLNVLHQYEKNIEIILAKVRLSMWKKGLNPANLMYHRLKRSKHFTINWIHNPNGKITQIDFETKKQIPAVFSQSPDFYMQEKTPLAKGKLKFEPKKGMDLITAELSDFPKLVPNQNYLNNPDCKLSDLDLINLSGQLHQIYGSIQIELAKMLRQKV